jgi:penicillin-binding protein 2
LGFYDAIAASCDVYFYHAGQKVGIDNLAKWAKNFGFGAKTEIDLSEGAETAGLVPTPEWKHRRKRRGPWVLGDLVNLSIGQGFLGATPTQLAVMTAAFANGGDVLRPQMVREILDVSQEKPVVVKRLQRSVLRKTGLGGEHLRAIVEGMKRVLQEHGTASGIQIPGLTVAGKTGSVEAVLNGREETHSVFVCFAPAENPKIALAVYIEKGNWGAETAAPIARKLLMKYFHIGQEQPPTEIARPTERRERGGRSASTTTQPANAPPQTPADAPAMSTEIPLKREENP